MHYVKYYSDNRNKVNYRWKCSKCGRINTASHIFTANQTHTTPGRDVHKKVFDNLAFQGSVELFIKIKDMNFGKREFKRGTVSGRCETCKHAEPWSSEYRYHPFLQVVLVLCALGALPLFVVSLYNQILWGFALCVLLVSLYPFFLSKKKKAANNLTNKLPIESIPVIVFGDIKKNAFEQKSLERHIIDDDLFVQAVTIVVDSGVASVHRLREDMDISIDDGVELIEEMERLGIIGEFGGKMKAVNYSTFDWNKLCKMVKENYQQSQNEEFDII